LLQEQYQRTAPPGHTLTVQIVDAFSNVIHQLGSASRTPDGKFILVGPDWTGQQPDGFLDILRVPPNYAGVFRRSFAARTPEAKARALAVLNQTGMYPLSANQSGQRQFDCESGACNTFFPLGVTAAMLAVDPDVARPEWVVPTKFWQDLKAVLAANLTVGTADSTMADQARSAHASEAPPGGQPLGAHARRHRRGYPRNRTSRASISRRNFAFHLIAAPQRRGLRCAVSHYLVHYINPWLHSAVSSMVDGLLSSLKAGVITKRS
jgi:hypothetical protein